MTLLTAHQRSDTRGSGALFEYDQGYPPHVSLELRCEARFYLYHRAVWQRLAKCVSRELRVPDEHGVRRLFIGLARQAPKYAGSRYPSPQA